VTAVERDAPRVTREPPPPTGRAARRRSRPASC